MLESLGETISAIFSVTTVDVSVPFGSTVVLIEELFFSARFALLISDPLTPVY
ncbi:unannotated protein [freshwater metagenome]|uniref:Unannotated protein n=1 Tax=freshwater metagenome TaxID=449393 RepID=A0A6J6GY67_9ZZZZ